MVPKAVGERHPTQGPIHVARRPVLGQKRLRDGLEIVGLAPGHRNQNCALMCAERALALPRRRYQHNNVKPRCHSECTLEYEILGRRVQ